VGALRVPELLADFDPDAGIDGRLKKLEGDRLKTAFNQGVRRITIKQ